MSLKLNNGNNTANSPASNSNKLPKSSRNWFASLSSRIAIALNLKNPGPKDLADHKFIKTIKKSTDETKNIIKDVSEQVNDWKDAEKRYQAIVDHIESVINEGTTSLDDIIATQKSICNLQDRIETLINNMDQNNSNALQKLTEINDNLQDLWDNQEEIAEQLSENTGNKPTNNSGNNTTP